jgi:hypothetical protein
MPTRKAQTMKLEVRRKMIAEELLAGRTYREIREKYKVSLATIHKDVKAILSRLENEQIAIAADARRLDLARIDVAIAGIFPMVKTGQVGYIDRWVKLLERRAKMLGYDAPAELALKRMDDVEEMSDEELAAIAAGNHQPAGGS